MSVTKQIKEQEAHKNGKNGRPTPAASGFPQYMTLDLSEDEKTHLMHHKDEWGELATLLKSLMRSDCILKLSGSEEAGFVEICLREKRPQWKDEKQVSFRAKSLETAVVGFHYALYRRAPTWPYKAPETIDF